MFPVFPAVMFTSDDFRAEVDRFLERTGMSASRFGREALGDPNFVLDLRSGRAPTLRVVERVSRFIRETPLPPPPQERAA